MHEPLSVEDRHALGRRRIVNILTTHRVCSGRTLENKIADAGPRYNRKLWMGQ
jgi:hypothetical protein